MITLFFKFFKKQPNGWWLEVGYPTQITDHRGTAGKGYRSNLFTIPTTEKQ